ncbi:hypothetical protein [Sphingobium nicotianae]|uniref:Uncharacterized protein n=1 Tax=Sphingobium nicotianae TaxID=2782607 RepID=A0A9X1DBZ3_9SPHN|nr:hypothetical protein [Sphingobium nicotianae]MBT2187211.1 hypothetical protein [Sphingobium nicotianae]
MKYFTVLLSLISTATFAQGTHTVTGYTRADGTYVAPHVQTNPNATKLDNWSTRGNVNPITGQAGTVDPYKPTTKNPDGSPYNSGIGGTSTDKKH